MMRRLAWLLWLVAVAVLFLVGVRVALAQSFEVMYPINYAAYFLDNIYTGYTVGSVPFDLDFSEADTDDWSRVEIIYNSSGSFGLWVDYGSVHSTEPLFEPIFTFLPSTDRGSVFVNLRSDDTIQFIRIASVDNANAAPPGGTIIYTLRLQRPELPTPTSTLVVPPTPIGTPTSMPLTPCRIDANFNAGLSDFINSYNASYHWVSNLGAARVQTSGGTWDSSHNPELLYSQYLPAGSYGWNIGYGSEGTQWATISMGYVCENGQDINLLYHPNIEWYYYHSRGGTFVAACKFRPYIRAIGGSNVSSELVWVDNLVIDGGGTRQCSDLPATPTPGPTYTATPTPGPTVRPTFGPDDDFQPIGDGDDFSPIDVVDRGQTCLAFGPWSIGDSGEFGVSFCLHQYSFQVGALGYHFSSDFLPIIALASIVMIWLRTR